MASRFSPRADVLRSALTQILQSFDCLRGVFTLAPLELVLLALLGVVLIVDAAQHELRHNAVNIVVCTARQGGYTRHVSAELAGLTRSRAHEAPPPPQSKSWILRRVFCSSSIDTSSFSGWSSSRSEAVGALP